MAGLDHLVGAVPPDNFEREFSLNEVAYINDAMERMYGPLAGRGLALRAGRAFFNYSLREFGPKLGVSTLAFRLLPIGVKTRMGIAIAAKFVNRYTDEMVEIIEEEDGVLWQINHCPLCWNRQTDIPCCQFMVGLFQEMLFWISSGKNFLIEERACIAIGDGHCSICIPRKPLD